MARFIFLSLLIVTLAFSSCSEQQELVNFDCKTMSCAESFEKALGAIERPDSTDEQRNEQLGLEDDRRTRTRIFYGGTQGRWARVAIYRYRPMGDSLTDISYSFMNGYFSASQDGLDTSKLEDKPHFKDLTLSDFEELYYSLIEEFDAITRDEEYLVKTSIPGGRAANFPHESMIRSTSYLFGDERYNVALGKEEGRFVVIVDWWGGRMY